MSNATISEIISSRWSTKESRISMFLPYQKRLAGLQHITPRARIHVLSAKLGRLGGLP